MYFNSPVWLKAFLCLWAWKLLDSVSSLKGGGVKIMGGPRGCWSRWKVAASYLWPECEMVLMCPAVDVSSFSFWNVPWLCQSDWRDQSLITLMLGSDDELRMDLIRFTHIQNFGNHGLKHNFLRSLFGHLLFHLLLPITKLFLSTLELQQLID